MKTNEGVIDKRKQEATLYEHEDGRYAIAPGTESPAFTHGDPKWRRVGPVDVSALATHTGAAVEPVKLNVIRKWPEGFAARLEHVWKDLLGFIPNYKLYDLQRVLAEFGFRMEVYDGAALTSAPAEPASSVCIDFKQATDLLAMFGDEPNEITLTHYPKVEHHFEEGFSVSAGLYAHYTDMPEEGGIYLGITDQEAMPDEPAEPVTRDPECEYIDELIFKLECFIDHATGGKLSKSSWALETLKAAHDEYVKAREDEAVAEVAETPPAAGWRTCEIHHWGIPPSEPGCPLCLKAAGAIDARGRETFKLPPMPEHVLADLQSANEHMAMWANGLANYVPRNGYDEPGQRPATITDVKRAAKFLAPRLHKASFALQDYFAAIDQAGRAALASRKKEQPK